MVVGRPCRSPGVGWRSLVVGPRCGSVFSYSSARVVVHRVGLLVSPRCWVVVVARH